MRTLMRRCAGIAAAVVLAVLLPPAAGRAHAQCNVGCVSSSSCEGTGKGSCRAVCDTYGTCGCADKRCATSEQLQPVAVVPDGDASRLVSASAESEARPAAAAALVVDCHGNVAGVRLFAADGQALFGELRTIRLRRPRAGEARLASRE